MEGIIMNFRIGRHTKSNNQMIVKVNDIDSKEKASHLVGKKVIWESPAKKQIIGIVSKAHGNKGVLRVKFEKGMPGQAINTKVVIE